MKPKTMRGNLTIGGGETRPDRVPTPRWTGLDCHLPPRQHPYSFEEILRHDPARPAIIPRTFGMMCASCGTRGCVRVRPRVYWCPKCESFSLLVIGKKLAGEGLKTFPHAPEPADTDALKARLASS